MATTKSTVVGIRLDHSRRAWVEAEAARRGVSVRVLFEGMIDGARTGETADDAARAIAGLASAPAPVVTDSNGDRVGDTSGIDEASVVTSSEGVNTQSASRSGSSPLPDLGSLTGLPSGIVRGAFSITTGLIRSSGRCARSRIESCPVTRLLGGRSA
ncbi:MAG: hypothetical protein ABSG39_13905 [Acidimicrobiales bacterium]|jgi:hypothetical protein